MYGRGQILRIDLTKEKITKEPIPEEARLKYLGGEGINDYLLWEHFLKVDVNSDPLGADNVLIAGMGPLGATGYGGGSKMKWTFKSPISNGFGDGASGGFLGANLRWSGYDHVVVTGKARHPVYIWVKDDQVEIRDASQLWGKNTRETHEAIRTETGDVEVATACIGAGGENLVGYATIINSPDRSGGKMGSGSVMGSKNLKAIASRGTGAIKPYDPQRFLESCDALTANLNEQTAALKSFQDFGTLILVARNNDVSWSCFRNDQYSVIPDERLAKIRHEFYDKNLKVAQLACSPGCIIDCGGMCTIKGNESPTAARFAGNYGKPEFSIMGSLGTMCDIADFPALIYFWDLCNKYGIDAMEIGVCSAFLMELWQRGIITQQDTVDWFGEPVSLEWGNHEAAEKIIHSVGRQNNKIGRILKQGVREAARIIGDLKGVPVSKYAIYGKFGVGHMNDVRSKVSWGTAFAVATRGCDHLKAFATPDHYASEELSVMYFGTPAAAARYNTTLKGASVALAENRQALINCLGSCVFVVNRKWALPVEFLANALASVTGEEMTNSEMLAAGERAVNLEKAFNSRLGFRRKDDTLCERWMREEVKEGPGKGWKAEDFLDQTLDEYYQYHGWGKKSGLQTKKKLEELGMRDVADVLEKEGALAAE